MTEIISIYQQVEGKYVPYIFTEESLIVKDVIDIDDNKKCIIINTKLNNSKVYLKTPLISSFSISDVVTTDQIDYNNITIDENHNRSSQNMISEESKILESNETKVNTDIISCFESMDTVLVQTISNSELDFLDGKNMKYRPFVKKNQLDKKKSIQLKLIQNIKKEYSDDYITSLFTSNPKDNITFDTLKQKNVEMGMIIELVGCIVESNILHPLIRVDQVYLSKIKSEIPGKKLNKCYFHTQGAAEQGQHLTEVSRYFPIDIVNETKTDNVNKSELVPSNSVSRSPKESNKLLSGMLPKLEPLSLTKGVLSKQESRIVPDSPTDKMLELMNDESESEQSTEQLLASVTTPKFQLPLTKTLNIVETEKSNSTFKPQMIETKVTTSNVKLVEPSKHEVKYKQTNQQKVYSSTKIDKYPIVKKKSSPVLSEDNMYTESIDAIKSYKSKHHSNKSK
jgi:hypothetical protein